MRLFAMLAMVAAALFAAPAAASAQEGFYAGVGYSNFSDEDVDVGAITVRGGYRFHRNFAAEADVSFGVDDDDGVELDNSVAIYGVGVLPVGEQVELLARIGYHHSEASVGPASGSEDGFAGGVGAQWNFTDRFGVRLDYTYLDGDDESVDVIGVTGMVRFN